ncbi:MAG: BNR-4 repeat-containing protein [Clostridia bacterium]|nr:BNR-4 repeat-containing protein [Clostridia bacterium]
MKKAISIIIAIAMMLATLPTLSFAAIAEHTASMADYGHSGSANGTGLFIGAVGTGGTFERAPYIAGTTGNNAVTVGSARIGAIAFSVDAAIDPDSIASAILNVHVNSVNGNLGSSWMLIAAYETANPTLTYTVGNMDQTIYPAVNNDYSYDAAFWSKERCSSGALGWKTMDVKRAVVNALEADTATSGKVNVVLRFQAPAAGYNISVAAPNAPYITIKTGDVLTATLKVVDSNNTDLKTPQTFIAHEGEYAYSDKIEETLQIGDSLYLYDANASTTTATFSQGGANVVTLVYTKYNEDDFYSGDTLIERGATCWFADPRSVKFEHDDIYDDGGNLIIPKSSKTLVGAIDTSGTVKAVQYDNLTGYMDNITIDTGFQADDHNNPTFLQLPDKRIMVFWSKHTAEEYWYYRVTNEPDDLTTLGTEKRIPVTGYGTYTYPSPFYMTDAPNSFFLCWRGVSWHPTIAKYSLPDKNGDIICEINPTQMVKTIGARPYVKYESNGKDRIYFSFTTAHPDNNNPNWLYYSEIDINTLNLYNVEGALLCEGANLPYGKSSSINTSSNYGSFTVDNPSNNRDWVWDIAKDADGNPAIAFTRISSDKSQHDYYYAKWNPTTKAWDKTYIADGGGWFHQNANAAERCYSGGLCLDHSNPSIVYLSKPTSGFYGDIYEIWKIEMDKTEVKSETQITRNSKYNNVRPYLAVGSDATDKINLTWMNGLYYYWIVSDALPDAFPTSIMTTAELNTVDMDTVLRAITIPNPDNILDSINLPAQVNGAQIEWTSSDKATLTDAPTQNGAYTVSAGHVTRGASDKKVTLTANVTYQGETREKAFNLTVKALKEEQEKTAYLYAYFRGSVNGSEEHLQIHFATSEDGLNWKDLNGNWPVLTSTMGTTGLRDPYIIRSRYGDKFYLLATDLNTLDGQGWTKWSMQGSKYLMVWESEDLVNWSKQRMVKFADDNIGCAWAPEAIYDETTDEYIVYASGKDLDATSVVDTVYVVRTRDFHTFSEPEIFLGGNGTAFIDSTVIKAHDGKFYRFSKGYNSVIMDVATTAHGPYTSVSEFTLDGKVSTQIKNVEGPAIFRFNQTTDKYCLLIDDYGTGAGFTPYITDNIASGAFTKAVCSMPTGAKHGVVVPISANEYAGIMEKWGSEPVDADGSAPILTYDFESAPSGTLNGNAKIEFDSVKQSNVLTLDGTNGTFFEFPDNLFDRRDTFTLSMDIKNNMTDGNYFTFAVGKDTNYYYYFKNSAALLRSALTISGYRYEERADVSLAEASVGAWTHIDIVVEPQRMAMYKNGVCVAENDALTKSISHIGLEDLKAYIGKSFFSTDAYFNGSFDNITLYNRALSDTEIKSGYALSDADAVVEDAKYVDFGTNINAVTGDIVFPTEGAYGSAISWKTSDANVIALDGTVTRPALGEDDVQVKLTATFTKGASVNTAEYRLTVKAQSVTWISTADFSCQTFDALSGVAYINFDITPSAFTDGLVAIASSAITPTNWGHYNIGVRVTPSGYFEAHNGTTFTYTNPVTYKVGNLYHATIKTDIAAQTYSFWITDENAVTTLVAQNFSYRSKSGGDLTKVNVRGGSGVEAGLFTVSNFKADYSPVLVTKAAVADNEVSYTVTNFGDEKTMDLYIACYDDFGSLILVNKTTKTSVNGNAVTETVTIPDGSHVSFMAWEECKMIPVTEAKRRIL